MAPVSKPVSLAERLSAVKRMSAAICQAQSEPDLLAVAGNHLHEIFGADWVGVGLRSTDGRRVRLIALPGQGAPDIGTDLPADGLAFTHAFVNDVVVNESDLESSSFDDLAGLAPSGMSSAVVVPLRIQSHAVGAFAFARSDGPGFDEEDCLVARQAAAFVASAIKSLRTVAEAQRAETERYVAHMILGRRAAELDSLNRISSTLERLDLGEALDFITEEIANQRGIEVCRISVVDDRGELQVVSSASLHGACFQDRTDLQADSPESVAVESKRRTLWRRPDADDTVTTERLRALGVTSVFSLPILSGDRAIGAFTAGSTGGHRLVTDEHIVMVDLVAKQLAAAVGDRGLGLWEALGQPTPSGTG